MNKVCIIHIAGQCSKHECEVCANRVVIGKHDLRSIKWTCHIEEEFFLYPEDVSKSANALKCDRINEVGHLTPEVIRRGGRTGGGVSEDPAHEKRSISPGARDPGTICIRVPLDSRMSLSCFGRGFGKGSEN